MINFLIITNLIYLLFSSRNNMNEKNNYIHRIDNVINLENHIEKTEKWILYPLEINGKFGFINQFGTLIVEPQFNRAKMARCGIAVGEKEQTMYYLDEYGNVLFSFESHGRIPDSFSDDLLAKPIKMDGELRWGFVDKNGHYVIPPIYNSVQDFSEGLAFVSSPNGENYYINKENIRVFGDQLYCSGGPFHFGYAFVMKQIYDDVYVTKEVDGLQYHEWVSGSYGGIINKKGELVIPYVLNANTIYSDGLFATSYKNMDDITDQSLQKIGYINELNETIIMTLLT